MSDSDFTMTLPDGRRLSYARYGPQNGRPVIHCHGSSGSRKERPFDLTLLDRLGVCLIVPDRPGHGGSTPQPDRRLIDWAMDMVALADHLGLDHFSVSGYSAGGPHAAAVAYRLPERVTGLGLMGSLAPFDRPHAFKGVPLGGRLAVWLAQRAPGLLRRTAGLQARAVRGNLDRTVNQFARTLPQAEQALLAQPAPRQVLRETLAEAYRQGGEGVVVDSLVYTAPWGFDLQEIETPTAVWQGELDQTAVPAIGRYLAGRIPQAELRLLPGAGHLALYTHWEPLLAER